MKIGARGHDLPSNNVEDMIQYCKDNGIEGLQLAVNKSWEEEYEAQDLKQIIENVRKLEENGVEIFVYGSYFNPVHSNELQNAEDYKRIRFNQLLALNTNCRQLGSETGSFNDDAWTFNPKNHTDDAYELVGKKLKTVIIDDVDFLVEVVSDHVIHDIESFTTLDKVVNHQCGLIIDLANIMNVDNQENYLEILESFLSKYQSQVKLFHHKNIVFNGEKKINVRLDEGIIDYPKVLNIIEKYNLSHIPVIVDELSGEDLEKSIEYLRKLDKKI